MRTLFTQTMRKSLIGWVDSWGLGVKSHLMRCPMQFIDRLCCLLPSPLVLLACLGISAVASCASTAASVRLEPQSVARSMGLAGCRVSVVLTPNEVVENSKRSGSPDPESNHEWIKMAADIQDGDQLRLVNCLGVKGVGDHYYYALFRNELIVLKLHPVIFD